MAAGTHQGLKRYDSWNLLPGAEGGGSIILHCLHCHRNKGVTSLSGCSVWTPSSLNKSDLLPCALHLFCAVNLQQTAVKETGR